MNASTPNPQADAVAVLKRRYWFRNLQLMGGLLSVWAFAGLGCGVLFADWLNQFTLPGTYYPLGFWFAQQGAIVVFVILVLIYATTMNRLDRAHHRALQELENPGGGS